MSECSSAGRRVPAALAVITVSTNKDLGTVPLYVKSEVSRVPRFRGLVTCILTMRSPDFTVLLNLLLCMHLFL